MDYYWILIVVLFLVPAFSGTNTWAPFQSKQVKEICQNMSKSERQTAIKRGALCGALLGIVPGAIGLILGAIIFRSALIGVIACLILFPLIALIFYKIWLPHVIESNQEQLASTEWAKSQGIRAEEIKLYSWQK